MTAAHLAHLASDVAGALEDLHGRQALVRMWRKDHTLWQEDPTEVADRLGWLDCPTELPAKVAELHAFLDEVRADGLTHVLVLGMGGSSLFPEVLARSFGPVAGGLELRVLDTTDPTAVAALQASLPLSSTLVLASSKSGGTIETRSHLEHFWSIIGDPRQFAVITDPGSELETLAEERAFRRIWRNDPDIGGRYSALSWFGLVPAVLLGLDTEALLAGAEAVAAAHAPGTAEADAEAVVLAATIGAAALVGHDKLTLVLPARLASFGLWLEQLVAESTGKHGRGVLPVTGEVLGPPEVYGHDRLFVAVAPDPGDADALTALVAAGHPVLTMDLRGQGEHALGAQVMLWELATALVGVVLGINPFDQPNVAEAKEATAKVLASGLPDIEPQALVVLLDQVRPGDYVALQVYADPDDAALQAMVQAARHRIRDRLHVATTVGYGPRFLHSTGQYHKGGPPTGVFAQLLSDEETDLPIPGRPFGFLTLLRAQAAGDLLTLQHHGLRAARHARRPRRVGHVKLGMVGLGRMGANMAERLRQGGHEVLGYDLAPEGRDVASLEELAQQLETPRTIWVMLPTGVPTDATVGLLKGLLAPGDLVVNGGNDHFRHDQELAAQLGEHGIDYIDAGVSGGVWGLTEGYGLMVGGPADQVARLKPVFDTLAPPGGFVHAGTQVGAGHYTKMVHNGIEYALMQAYGEGYELLTASELGIDAPAALAAWRHGTVIRSWLLDLLVLALEADPTLAQIKGWADDTGEGRWTVEEAVRLAVPAPAITASLFARFSSRQDDSPTMKVVAALRQQFGGHAIRPS